MMFECFIRFVVALLYFFYTIFCLFCDPFSCLCMLNSIAKWKDMETDTFGKDVVDRLCLYV